MKVEREAVLKLLETVSVGTSPRELLEQSNCFAFTGESIVTFNGEILARAKSPFPEVKGAVPAEDLRQILHKLPDELLDVSQGDGELRIEGKRKAAGITMAADISLPYIDVPEPGDWSNIPPELPGTLLQAARICGRDSSQPRTTEVHVTPQAVEACDNYRLFRTVIETGLTEMLIPATSLDAVGGIAFARMSQTKGCLHLRTKGGVRVSLRSSVGDYPDLRPLLKLESPKRIKLPGNLPDILSRAEVMQSDSLFDRTVSVHIEAGKLTLRARKDGGWYREMKEVEYEDDPLRFDVNPSFLEEILARTRNVQVSNNRMKIKSGGAIFIVCLEVEEEKERPKGHGSQSRTKKKMAANVRKILAKRA